MKQWWGDLDGERETKPKERSHCDTRAHRKKGGKKSVETAVVEAKLHLCDRTLWTARRMKWSHMSEEPRRIQINSVTASPCSLRRWGGVARRGSPFQSTDRLFEALL